MSLIDFSKDKIRPDIAIYIEFPTAMAMAIYRFILGIGNKGAITKLSDKDDYDTWRDINKGIKACRYHARLWKGLYAKTYPCCSWCRHPGRKLSEEYNCPRYLYSRKLVNKLFGIDPLEIDFIFNNLTDNDKKKLQKKIFDQVEFIVPHKQERRFYDNRVKGILTKLEQTGHIRSKMNKGRLTFMQHGLDEGDIRSEMLSAVSDIVNKYTYLPEMKVLKSCGRALGRELNNSFERLQRKKRKYNFRPNNVAEHMVNKHNEKGDGQATSFEELKIFSDDLNVEETLGDKLLFDATLKAADSMSSKFYKHAMRAITILQGGEDPDFMAYLRSSKVIKANRKWETFYDKSSPRELMDLINQFAGLKINRVLQRAVELKLTSQEGGNPMSENTETVETETQGKIKIVFPKKRCSICTHLVPWLGKKRIPKNCDTDYPGCPTHAYEVVYAFPIENAAIQLLGYMADGDDDEINEFMSRVPNATEVMQRAMELQASGEYELPEREEVIEDEFTDMSVKELRDFFLESDEMFDVPMENIAGLRSMDADQLRAVIREHLAGKNSDIDADDEIEDLNGTVIIDETDDDETDDDNGDDDDDDDDLDDLDEDLSVVGTISSEE